MMQQERWAVLLLVGSVLFVFCAARAVRRPAASDAAQRIEVGASRAPANENQTDARFREVLENVDTFHAEAAGELQWRQLETAQAAQRMKQQEAARELQRRQQEATRPLAEES